MSKWNLPTVDINSEHSKSESQFRKCVGTLGLFQRWVHCSLKWLRMYDYVLVKVKLEPKLYRMYNCSYFL